MSSASKDFLLFPAAARVTRVRGGALLVLSVLLGLLLVAGACAAQVAEELVGPQEVPSAGYESWSLFLVCTPDWVMPERADDLRNLYWGFKAFGDAIGRNNIAIWFWKKKTPIDSSQLSANVDVERSSDYCRTLSLRPSEGPFLVITTAYPDLAAFPKDRAIFALGGVSASELGKLLNSLTDQLLIERKVAAMREPEHSSTASGTASNGLWIQLLESTRRTLIGVGCAVKLQITTAILTAELRGCER